jgi:3-oxoacyl-[acyl-carrier protein] reductase
MDFGLKGKRAIVMAASRGLGYACAMGLAREGCHLVMCSRDEKRIESAADTIRREIVVHNAGGPPAGETLAMTEEQWQKAFEQNLLSFTRIVGAAAPQMEKAKYGRVLTIASSSIKQPIPNLSLSNALRAGVWGIAKTLSRELAPKGILVNVIAPGRIDTERIAELDQANAQKSGKTVDDVRKASVASIPLGRLGRPEELANLVVFLASQSASYITGQAITVDGAAGNAL